MRARASALAAYAVAMCVAAALAQRVAEVEKRLMEWNSSESPQPPSDAPRLPAPQSSQLLSEPVSLLTSQALSEPVSLLTSQAPSEPVAPCWSMPSGQRLDSLPQTPTQAPLDPVLETARPSTLTPCQSSHPTLGTSQPASRSTPQPPPQTPLEPHLHVPASPPPQLRTSTPFDLPPRLSSSLSPNASSVTPPDPPPQKAPQPAPQWFQLPSDLTLQNTTTQQTSQPATDTSPQTPPKSPPELSQQASQPAPQPSPQFTPQSPPEPLPQPSDSGKECTCLRKSQPRQWLDCSGRNRSVLREEDMCYFTTVVFLSNNSFVSLPANLSEDIRGVNISHNLLTTIPRSPPLHLRTHTLDVSFNRIAYSSDELRPLSYLQTLAVRGNRLQSLNFLPSPCSLSKLLADHNQLRSLDGPINDCFVLRDLDVSWNQLGALPKDAIEGLNNVQRLKMVHAGLTSIAPGAFDGLRSVQFFDLSENKLMTLPSRAFPHRLLETLLLDKNTISSLPPDVFSGLRKVKKISLAQNKLENIPQSLFLDLQNLEHLNLSENYLRYLPDKVFADLKNLTEIGFQSNFLENLPPQLFSGLKNLKRINLGGNNLTSVSGDLLAGLSNLDLLDLSDNQLTTVPPGLFNGVKSIEVLDLSFNSLSTFSGSHLEGLDHVGKLYLKGNQLRELPVFDAMWPQVVSFNLEKNHIEELGEAAVRSWLGDGSQERRVTLGNRQWLRSVESLGWAVDDPEVATIVDAVDCRCGFLRRDRAHLFFCAAVSCPADYANWVHEVATRGADSQRAKG